MLQTSGLHHITAITADPQKNVDFYEGFLGQRFVKKTVNFDDPNAYHLYYGDYVGTPGTALTFFSWKGMRKGVRGHGEASVIYYRIPRGSGTYWRERSAEFGVPVREITLFNENALSLQDPDAHELLLIESTFEEIPDLTAWTEGPIPSEHALLGFYGIQLSVENIAMIDLVLTEALGYSEKSAEDGIVRFAVAGSVGKYVDVIEMPDALQAQQGVGSIHHVAFRSKDDDEREAFRWKLEELGITSTGLIDRVFFHSSYFRTPAKILFELATDNPGFTVNESAESLGESLVLPVEYEPLREKIEDNLDPITLPRHAKKN